MNKYILELDKIKRQLSIITAQVNGINEYISLIYKSIDYLKKIIEEDADNGKR